MKLSSLTTSLGGASVFLSASIPDTARWDGAFNVLEITDAVVAIAREVLQRGGRLVTAAHPTIAPLLLYVASEQRLNSHPTVVVYQSAVFDAVLPESTLRFEAEGVGSIVRTAAAFGESADPVEAIQSLDLMRRQMLTEEEPVAAIFVGGMGGIIKEHALFREIRDGAPTYALGHPGGAAAGLVEESPPALRAELANGDVYPAIARRILDDLANWTNGSA
ncbi:hypothetical protein IM660_11790 [Ruania alkalisoli]|uniref:Uncharacterized protein n=1 Tax=Ruania alkalisoli TaxID=2779775 RepID=A0A7M1SP88_9MICO|nr:hypothetical protein IM660_11790 [Ruania alkalisoli]